LLYRRGVRRRSLHRHGQVGQVMLGPPGGGRDGGGVRRGPRRVLAVREERDEGGEWAEHWSWAEWDGNRISCAPMSCGHACSAGQANGCAQAQATQARHVDQTASGPGPGEVNCLSIHAVNGEEHPWRNGGWQPRTRHAQRRAPLVGEALPSPEWDRRRRRHVNGRAPPVSPLPYLPLYGSVTAEWGGRCRTWWAPCLCTRLR
jgi:hypothetical protein